MIGTIINVGAVVVGTVTGIALGKRLPQRMQETVFDALGLLTLLRWPSKQNIYSSFSGHS